MCLFNCQKVYVLKKDQIYHTKLCLYILDINILCYTWHLYSTRSLFTHENVNIGSYDYYIRNCRNVVGVINLVHPKILVVTVKQKMCLVGFLFSISNNEKLYNALLVTYVHKYVIIMSFFLLKFGIYFVSQVTPFCYIFKFFSWLFLPLTTYHSESELEISKLRVNMQY